MWLEAIIAHSDLVRVLGRLLPVKIYLDREEDTEEVEKDRWLALGRATQVALVPDAGLRVTCPAELSWSIAGVSTTANIDELQVMIRPQVIEKHKGHVLEFGVEVEEVDFHSLPDFVDATIVKAVNGALAKKKLPWNFTETLTRNVSLGAMLDPVEALDIAVTGGKLRITAEALVLMVSFELTFVRGD